MSNPERWDYLDGKQEQERSMHSKVEVKPVRGAGDRRPSATEGAALEMETVVWKDEWLNCFDHQCRVLTIVLEMLSQVYE